MSKKEFEKAQERILSALSSGEKTRKTLLALDKDKFSDKQLKDNSPNSPYTQWKSMLGNAVTWLENTKRITLNGDKYRLTEKLKTEQDAQSQVAKDEEIRGYILKALVTSKKKKEILSFVVGNYTNRPNSKEGKTVSSIAGQILSAMVKVEEVFVSKGTYSLVATKQVSKKNGEQKNKKNTKIPEKTVSQDKIELHEAYKEPVVGAKDDARQRIMSPEALENLALGLLQKIFNDRHLKVTRCENIDGPQDGGIDGIIIVEDDLGFQEKVIMQAKYKKEAKFVPQCEIREFCGVLSAEDGATLGIFVTNGTFHADTKKFIKKYTHKRFALLDGEKIQSLAKEHNYNWAL